MSLVSKVKTKYASLWHFPCDNFLHYSNHTPPLIHPLSSFPAVGTKVMQKARVKDVLLDDFGDPEGRRLVQTRNWARKICQRCACALQTVLCTTKKALTSYQTLFLVRGWNLVLFAVGFLYCSSITILSFKINPLPAFLSVAWTQTQNISQYTDMHYRSILLTLQPSIYKTIMRLRNNLFHLVTHQEGL